MPEKTIMTFHEKYKQYDLGEGHPFRGDRFLNAIKFFEDHRLLQQHELELVAPEPASKEDLLRVHDENYVDLIFRLARENKPYDFETPVSAKILEAALLIIGGAVECGRNVAEKKVKRGISLGGGFHHAGRRYGGGFCLFNDVAVLVEYLRIKHKFEKFLLLDYDVHYGNGTSDIYYEDPSVLYISLHQDPRTIYPGTGFTWQIGEGSGKGFNISLPLPPGTGDETYLYALEEIFVPLAEEFKPQIVIANGGSDSHFADTLGSLSLTSKGFFNVSRLIRETADKVCDGKLIIIPGSGYNPNVLPLCWYALAAGAAGLKEIDVEEPEKPPKEPAACGKTVEKTIDDIKRLLRAYWTCFGGFNINDIP
jgi:acetoin utilization protein AcuC